MARSGKQDITDIGKKKEQVKKEKPTVTKFSDVADTKVIELPHDNTLPNDPPVQEVESEHIPTPETKEEHEEENEHVHDKFTEQFLKQFTEKSTKEDTHTRQTWLIKNETIKRLDKLAKGKKKGFKTELVNQALEILLDRIEKK
ncbi:hypothetical protein [Bacillus toyonensis]|uniref:hypothetical protein n=1 Tax=Bacillus toyonensis TaxID=155322 RepID=UPI000C017D5B|nr:hypothetical protein [Bacillus toyonensis]PGA92169.1 hypothetical protein COL93_26580 [Bacillus toyonensis]